MNAPYNDEHMAAIEVEVTQMEVTLDADIAAGRPASEAFIDRLREIRAYLIAHRKGS